MRGYASRRHAPLAVRSSLAPRAPPPSAVRWRRCTLTLLRPRPHAVGWVQRPYPLRPACQLPAPPPRATELSNLLSPDTMGLLTATTAVSNALWRRASRASYVQECCRVFNVSGPDELQDLLAALVLCECVYKKVDMPEQQLVDTIGQFLADFPPGLVSIDTVQLSHNGVPQNYLLAAGGRSIYAVFMGTKQARDMVADVNAFHEAVWTEALQVAERSQVPTAHRGFLARSKAIDVEGLYRLAQDSGRRLVLCGHSLGGAVAKLCALRLLREQPEWPPLRMQCITFASPAIGNSALAELVEAAGWAPYFTTYILPEDQLMKALSFTTVRRQQQQQQEQQQQQQAARRTEPAGGRASPSGGTGATHGAAAPVGAPVGAPEDAPPPIVAGGREALRIIALPWTRESAKRTLRRELKAEEVSTTPLDAAAADVAEARAVGAPVPASSAAQLAAARAAQPRGPTGPAAPPAAAADDAAIAAAAAALAATDGASLASEGEEQDVPGSQPMLDPRNLGLLLQLQHRWAGHQLRRAAAGLGASIGAARSLVSPFHPFGEQWFISEGGVVAPSELPPDGAPLSDASAAFSAANPGIINFHRMVAYRTRVLQVLSATAAALRTKGLRLPEPAAALAAAAPTLPVPVVPPVPVPVPLSGASTPKAPRLGSVLPPVVVEAATARPPIPQPVGARLLDTAMPPLPAAEAMAAAVAATAEPAATPPPSRGGSPPGTTGVAAPRATQLPRRGPLAFLPGGRLKEDLLPLAVRVRGRGLDACGHVGLRVFGETFLPVELSRAAAKPLEGTNPDASIDAAAAAPQGAWAQLASLQHALRRRVRRAAAAVASVTGGPAPAWRPPQGQLYELSLRVLLPRSIVTRLLAATPTSGPVTLAGAGAAAPPPLVLQLKSDCQVVSVPVALEPYLVGVVGSSQAAAALAAALLSGEAQLEGPAAAPAAQSADAAPAAPKRWPAVPGWMPRPSAWLASRQAAASKGQASAAVGSAPEVPRTPSLVRRERLRQLQEERAARRRAREAEAAASGGVDWVEPWVAPQTTSGPVAPKQQLHSPPQHQQQAAKQPLAPVAGTKKGLSGLGTGRSAGSAAPPRTIGSSVARKPVSPQRPGKAALAAPVAVGPRTAAVARRGGAPAGRRPPQGASRLPAVAATVDEVELAGEQAAAIKQHQPQGPFAGLLSRARGLLPGGPAAAAAAHQATSHEARAAAATVAPSPATVPVAAPSAAAAALPATQFILLPTLTTAKGPSTAPGAGQAAPVAAAAAAAKPPGSRAGRGSAAGRHLDAVALVVDVDSVLFNGGATARALVRAAAAAASGAPVVALLLQPSHNPPREVHEEAARVLAELLGALRVPVVTLDVRGVNMRRWAVAAYGGAAPPAWGPALAALPPARRAELAAQVADARAALQAALARHSGDGGGGGGGGNGDGAWGAPPVERSKL